MNRRDFLIGGATIGVVSSPAGAAIRCGLPMSGGVQICESGIPNIQHYGATMRCPQWCWAACIQTIFAYSGRYLPQEQIASKLFGKAACGPANSSQIVKTISAGSWTDHADRFFRANTVTLADSSIGIINQNMGVDALQYLNVNRPLIIGALGHATVLTSIHYLRDALGRIQVQGVIVMDPWPGSPPFRKLSPQELFGTQLLLAVVV